MNGFQALIFSEATTQGLFTQPKQLSNKGAENNTFFELLTTKTVNNNENNHLLSQLFLSVQQVSEQLDLDESIQEQLITLIQSMFEDAQLNETTNISGIKEVIDSQLIETFIPSIAQFIGKNKEISVDKVIDMLITSLKQNDFFSPLLPERLDNNDLMFKLVSSSLRLHLNGVSKSDQQEQLMLANQLIQKFFSIVEERDFEASIQRQAPFLLKLLGQWQSLNEDVRLMTVEENLSTNKSLTKLWDELYNRFNKRTNSLVQTTYHHDSKVSSQDISNWLKHLMPKVLQSTQLTQPVQIPNFESINPMMQSPIEQYIIYTRLTDGEDSVRDQLMAQFRQIMKTSQFSLTQPGVNQLSMTLKPNNLGEMLVRFTEINGEMTVKILVTSQATKSILEGNIHQLKHMFAPHQVLIEKVDDNQNLIVKEESLQEDTTNEQEHEATEENKDEQFSEQEGLDFGQLLENYI